MKKGLIFIVILVVVFAGLYLFKNQIFKVEKEKVSETGNVLSEEEIEKINNYQPAEKPKNNEYGFHVASTPGVYPKFHSGKIISQTFAKRPGWITGGEKMDFQIKVSDPEGFKEVKIMVVGVKKDQLTYWPQEIENLKQVVETPFTLIEGDEKQGTWAGSLTVPTETKRIIFTNFYALNHQGQEESLELGWADITGTRCSAESSLLGKGVNLTTPYGSVIDVNAAGYNMDRAIGTTGSGEIKIAYGRSINLAGDENNSAYLVFGSRVIFDQTTGGGNITFSDPAGGHATAIMIKQNTRDSRRTLPADLCVQDQDDDGYVQSCYGLYPIPSLIPSLIPSIGECPTGYGFIDLIHGAGSREIWLDCDDNNPSDYPGATLSSSYTQSCTCPTDVNSGAQICMCNPPDPGPTNCNWGTYGGVGICMSGSCASYGYTGYNLVPTGTPCTYDQRWNCRPCTPTTASGSQYNITRRSLVCQGTFSLDSCICGVTQPSTFTLAVTKSGIGSGTVSSSPTGITCGATCSASFNAGTTVVLTAAPGSGVVFAGWSGAGCSGTSTCTVIMDAAKTVNATFNIPTSTLTLAVTKSGAGSGTVTSSPAGITCGATCSASFTAGNSVVLTAAPASGSYLTGWSACSGTGTCTVIMDANKTVDAGFFACIPNGSSCLIVKPEQCCSGYCPASVCQKFIPE